MSEKEDSSQNPHENQKILCTMHNDGTQGGPCQVVGRMEQTPWEEHSLQASAEFSIVVGANRLGILVYVDTFRTSPHVFLVLVAIWYSMF